MAENNRNPGHPGRQGPRESQERREPSSSSNRRRTQQSARETDRVSVRREYFDRMEEGDEGTSEWEGSARNWH